MNITTEYTVWCSECEEWYQTPSSRTKAMAVKEFKSLGWKLIKNKEWLCPKCKEKHKAKSPE